MPQRALAPLHARHIWGLRCSYPGGSGPPRSTFEGRGAAHLNQAEGLRGRAFIRVPFGGTSAPSRGAFGTASLGRSAPGAFPAEYALAS